jgi:hypothetical protein
VILKLAQLNFGGRQTKYAQHRHLSGSKRLSTDIP